MKLNNKLAAIATTDKYKKYLLEKLKEKNVKNIDECLFFIEYSDIYKNIEEINTLSVDFIIIEKLELFKDFDNLQQKSNILILNPIDTIASYLIGDLNKFPLWGLDSRLANPLLERYNIAYQVLDKTSKEVFKKLNISNNILDDLNLEIEKYIPTKIDSLILNLCLENLPSTIKGIDIYEINSKYLKKTIDILFM